MRLNKLHGKLENGKTWEVRLSISKAPVPMTFYINAKVFIDGKFDNVWVKPYGHSKCGLDFLNYAETSRLLLEDIEYYLGVEILKPLQVVA